MSKSCDTRCFVPFCKSGCTTVREKNKKLGIKNPSRFRAPKDPLLLKKWALAIRRGDKMITPYDVVCELHFQKEDIRRFYETKLPDGTISRLKMGVPRLREDAIPSIFPYGSHNLKSSEKKKKRSKGLSSQKFVQTTKRKEVSNFNNTITIVSTSSYTFAALIDSLQSILKPNSLWTINFVGEFIICARWTLKYTCVKRIIIEKDMSLKVFLRDVQVYISRKQITCIEDVSLCLKEVESINIIKKC
ncbi:uncharacterized protein LOC118187451 [Stegodyphus dumicola]|uniref:uncharacterized protein LOC118187451 n=1 Tax=Stegodyphus dumicola TaxID=202533 RepID=UPI0015AC574E|nr:uncharacterized protein LOC118187451 [Stegodyphus dumicola]XP_035213568.1 uncharacterized protein LOC118187451 [Stegodyphus dumicola]